jgi:hypothetical protein
MDDYGARIVRHLVGPAQRMIPLDVIYRDGHSAAHRTASAFGVPLIHREFHQPRSGPMLKQ